MFAMHAATALGYFFLGRYDEASSWAESALRLQSRFFLALCVAAASAALAGREAEAARAIARLRAIDPTATLRRPPDPGPIRRPEDFARWKEGLRLAGLPE